MNCFDKVQCEECNGYDVDSLRAVVQEDEMTAVLESEFQEEDWEAEVEYTAWLKANPQEAQSIYDKHEELVNGKV